MQPEELLRGLSASTAEVLETMFFTCPNDEEPVGAPESGEGWVTTRLGFRGAPSGSLALSVSPEAAQGIASDFLGCEPGDLSLQQVDDVVSEMANMICGSLLSRVECDATFELMHPEGGVAFREQEAEPGSTTASRVFELENGFMAVRVELEGK